MDIDNKYGNLVLQKELLLLLKDFHKLCVTHEIKYSLAYGSLLGAIRHKGFIPWDDDLDIIVDRENYQRLLSTVAESDTMQLDRHLWLDIIRRKGYVAKQKRLATIDIFILDRVPDRKLRRYLKEMTIFMLQGMMKSKNPEIKASFWLKCASTITRWCGHLFSNERKFKWYSGVSSWWNSEPSKFVGCYDASFADVKLNFINSVFDNVHIAPFENLYVYVIDEYDDFLTSRYGDYMTPRQQKRKVQV